MPNVKLLTYYGFALRDNPHTTEGAVGLQDPDSTLRHGDETQEEDRSCDRSIATESDRYTAKLMRARARTAAVMRSLGAYDDTLTSDSAHLVAVPAIAMRPPRVATGESVRGLDESCVSEQSVSEAPDVSTGAEPQILSSPEQTERTITIAHATSGEVECPSIEWIDTLAHMIIYLDEELKHSGIAATQN